MSRLLKTVKDFRGPVTADKVAAALGNPDAIKVGLELDMAAHTGKVTKHEDGTYEVVAKQFACYRLVAGADGAMTMEKEAMSHSDMLYKCKGSDEWASSEKGAFKKARKNAYSGYRAAMDSIVAAYEDGCALVDVTAEPEVEAKAEEATEE